MLSTLPSRTIRCLIQDVSQVGESRRLGQKLAAQLAFDTTQAGKLAIVTTELANNIIKHGTAGELLFRPLEHAGEPVGVEVLAIDNGRGMGDVARHLVDGYSTAGTSGTGLGAIRRLADDFAIYSTPGKGTAVVSRVRANGRAVAADRYRLGAVCVEKPGEAISGDGWCVVQRADTLLAMVVDGLGHGALAAEAAHEAIRVASETSIAQPAQLLELIHSALQKTRGAAVAVAAIAGVKATLRYAGLGNIAGAVLSGSGEQRRSLISQNGTAGVEARRIQEYTYPWERNAMLVMNSDGLKNWNIDNYIDAPRHDPAVIAGLLYRDFRRGTDDVTVLAVAEQSKH